jgi:DNA-binding transcriptional LysR family regulator
MIDVRRLKVLQAVVETGSVAAAAVRLNYTPSAVSQQMSTLERETGVQLLERVGRGVRPTEAALLLCEHTSRVFASIKDAEDALVALRMGQSGRLRLGAFPSASSSLIPSALAAFRSQHPNVVLEIVVAEPDEVVSGLRDGALDIAVTTLMTSPDDVTDGGLQYHFLLSDPYRVVLPRSHALSPRGTIELESLAREDWVGVTSCPGHCQLAVEDACERAGFRPAYALEADEYPTALGFVAAGLGVALMPLLALQNSVPTGVVVRPLEGPDPVRSVWAVTRSSLAEQIPILAMLSCLADVAKESQLSPSPTDDTVVD